MPVISSDKVQKATKEKLYKKRKETATAKDDATGDDFYVIESVEEVKIEGGKQFFKIKWAGFSAEENTWESESSVPAIIQRYYEKEENLGKPLPKPTIKHHECIFFATPGTYTSQACVTVKGSPNYIFDQSCDWN